MFRCLSRRTKALPPSQASKDGPPVIYLDSPFTYTRHRRAAKLRKTISDIDKREAYERESFLAKHKLLGVRTWYFGHICVLISSIISVFLCITRQVHRPYPRLFYRLTFVQICWTYGVSLLNALNGARPGFFGMLPLPTFQYMLAALVAIFTVPHTIKLTPFVLMSALHVADTHSSHHANAAWPRRYAEWLSTKVAPKAAHINAYLYLWLLVELTWDCILVRPAAVVALGFYSFLFKIRMLYSPITQHCVRRVYDIIDNFIVEDRRTPKGLRNLWIRLRNKFGMKQLDQSDLYAQDTDKAIDKANLMGVLFF